MTVNRDELTVVLGWLSAIHARAPTSKIFLVGTGCDEAYGNGIMKFEDSIPEAVLDQLVVKENIAYGRFTHTTSAKTSAGVKELRRSINESVNLTVFQEGEKPIDWILFQDEIVNIINERKYLISVPFEFLLELGGKFRIQSAKELSALLKYWHEIGVVLYYPDNHRLRETVFINPQSIINAVALLFKMNDDPFQIQTSRLKALRELTKRKVWRLSLIFDVLHEVVSKDMELFIEVLKEFDLLCITSEDDLNVEESSAILPFLLQNQQIHTHDLLSKKAGFENIDFGLSFPKTYLPPGLFHQLAVRFGSRSKYRASLFQQSALVFVGEAAMIIRERMESGFIHFSILVQTANIRSDFANAWPIICNTIENVVFSHWSKSAQYNLGLICVS
ncbi:Leucine-rich repeat serine/threonine-protein kinase 2 [Nowakowskiella sp. JEL0407]|nr:Leucine-rich repeat serine/threonine-protein kinase 2 [Nowakowskiella sp. JEL0407]